MLRTLNNSFDFHCHSHWSDGELSPTDLMQRAFDRGLKHIALTDHDTLDGLGEAEFAATKLGLYLIAGTEITTSTEFGEVHIVGLVVDKHNNDLLNLLKKHQTIRFERAQQIEDQLQKAGVPGALEQIKKNARQVITRAHFAQSLVKLGYAKDPKQAFKRYLGKSGRVKIRVEWSSLEQVVSTILQAGGVPVLAHPTRYPISNRKLGLLISAFSEAGGRAIEMAFPGVSPNQLAWLERHREANDLMASSGSDFHSSGRPWCDLGRFFGVTEGRPHIAHILCQH